jgi:hypothetical protein
VALAKKASARLLQLLNGNAILVETFGLDNNGKAHAGDDPYQGPGRWRYPHCRKACPALAGWRGVVVSMTKSFVAATR